MEVQVAILSVHRPVFMAGTGNILRTNTGLAAARAGLGLPNKGIE